ncbi:transposable element tc3 transposase, partial [Lasius niger]
DLFNATYPDREPISKSTVERTVGRFQRTGVIKDAPRSGRPKNASNDEKALDVLLTVYDNPHTSVSRTAQENDISTTSVHRILKKHHYHPYKIHLVQELSEDDYDRRVEFCDTMMTRFADNRQFFNWICFSDEATFELNGSVNRQNMRYWADENPHWMRDSHTQYPQKVNVWAGIILNRIIGPFFIEGNINSQNYCNLLRNQVIPAIQDIAGEAFHNKRHNRMATEITRSDPIRLLLLGVFENKGL